MAATPTQERSGVGGYRHGRVPRAMREAQLLDLAERLFIENGYSGFSIEALCTVAGVSRPLVYKHFASKDEIYLACVRRIRAEFEQAMLDAASGSADLRTTLELGADAWFSILEHQPERWSLVYGGAPALSSALADQLADQRQATVQQIAAAVARFTPNTDAERLAVWANAVSGAGEQLGRWWLRHPEIPRHRIVAHHRELLEAAAERLLGV